MCDDPRGADIEWQPDPPEGETWTTQDGRTLLLSEMEPDHLDNAINMLIRQVPALAKLMDERERRKKSGSRRYYLDHDNPTITGLWRYDSTGSIYAFDLCGNTMQVETGASGIRGTLIREITKQQAAAMILTARAKQFRATLNTTYCGEVVHVGDRNVTAVFEVEDSLIEYIIPVESFGMKPKVGDALLGSTQIHHLGALRLQGWQSPREHKRKNIVPLPRTF
jgi:hypothetical protein